MKGLSTNMSVSKMVGWFCRSRIILTTSPAHVEVDVSMIEGPQPNAPSTSASTSALSAKKKRKHLLSTSTDPVYEELRDINFSQIGAYLNKIAKTIDQRYKVG